MGSAEPGDVLAGRYRLRSVLGRGGMGVVWLASDELLHRDVAVKEVLWVRQPSAEGQESRRERAFREARAVAGLDHPNIAGIYDIVQDDGRSHPTPRGGSLPRAPAWTAGSLCVVQHFRGSGADLRLRFAGGVVVPFLRCRWSHVGAKLRVGVRE